MGVANVASRSPATSRTLFRLGSTSKIFVGLAALKLEAEGNLGLQDTLRSRAPELDSQNLWEGADPVRIVHLLEHTSGWGDMKVSAYAEMPNPEGPLAIYFPLWANARTSPLCAIVALVASIRQRRVEPNLLVWWTTFARSVLLVVIASYLAYSDVIGIRTWK